LTGTATAGSVFLPSRPVNTTGLVRSAARNWSSGSSPGWRNWPTDPRLRASGGHPGPAPGAPGGDYHRIFRAQRTFTPQPPEYLRLVERGGAEFRILLDLSAEELRSFMEPGLVEGILRVREGQVRPLPGYDGVYGQVRVFPPNNPTPLRPVPPKTDSCRSFDYRRRRKIVTE